MPDKIKGAVAVLSEKDAEGREIGHKIVFRPYCHVYLPKLRDALGEVEFGELENLQKRTSPEVAERAMKGEVVDVTIDAEEGEEVDGCPVTPDKYVKINYIGSRGRREDLIQESVAKRLGYTYCVQVK
jgi:hypothetical protein